MRSPPGHLLAKPRQHASNQNRAANNQPQPMHHAIDNDSDQRSNDKTSTSAHKKPVTSSDATGITG
jgi:hypothetical protein